jgi:hypothetical protein
MKPNILFGINFKMPIRKTTRARSTFAPSSALTSTISKVFLVGPTLSGKTSFVKSFFNETMLNSYADILNKVGIVGLEAYPITYQGKKYNLWDASSYIDEHLSSWGKGSNLIVVFGDDESWLDKMANLYPNTPIKMYNPESKISNLQP